MPKWVPTTDFEEQQLELQPDCDITFGYYGRNILDRARPNEDEYSQAPANLVSMRESEFNFVQKIHSAMNPDAFVGRRLTIEELERTGSREKEIISMIRRAGMGPSVDEGLCSSRTIPAIESDKPYSSRKFPVLYDENYFKLKPRKLGSESSSSLNSSTDDNRSEERLTNGEYLNDTKNNLQIETKTAIIDIQAPGTSTGLENKLRQCTLGSPSKDTNLSEKSIDVDGKSPRKTVVETAPSVSKLNNNKKKTKIAANFSGVSANKSTPSGSTPRKNNVDEKRHTAIKFVTPAELYKKKRKNSSGAQVDDN